jgi:heptosyltransferase-2
VAQTWLVTERKLRSARRADALLRPIFPLLRAAFAPTGHTNGAPRKILVSELWHIGDVVIAMPFLAALRQRFPHAEITLLAKAHATETLANTGLVDRFITFALPWTFIDEDRRTWRSWLGLPALVRRLRSERFDLAFDCSRDGRNHLLLYLSGAARRVGFGFGGGEFLLTDPVPAGSLDLHRTEDWLRLLTPFVAGSAAPVASEPRLVISDKEREWLDRFLSTHRVRSGDFVVGVHPGGSSRLKRWSVESFEAMARVASDEFDARILWIVDPAGTAADASLPEGSIRAKPTLRQLIALLSRCNLLICNDGGPMHLAAALGVPTFAVYSWGKPEWWRPPFQAVRHSWIQRLDIECRPCAGHCVFAEPICLTGLSVDNAIDALRSELQAVRPRNESPLHASSR